MQARILIADDQADILAALRLLLKREGFEVATATSPAGVLDVVSRERIDVALVDLNYARDTTSGKEGLDLVDQLRRRDPEMPVVVMTAWATVDVAVQAMRHGANDFIEKPWDNQRLMSVLRNQVALAQARRQGRRLADENAILRASDGAKLVATSAAMQDVVRLARQVAPSDASVLITGEPGTGKSLLARLMHDWSARAEKSFISVNIGGLPESVFESEMFGHVQRGVHRREGRPRRADSSWPMVARCSSTRSATCRPRSRRGCCGRSRPESTSASVLRAPSAPMYESSRRPTPTCRR